MESIQVLSDLIFQISQQIPDQTYRHIMDVLQTIAVPKLQPLSVEVLMTDFHLGEGIATYIVRCMENPEYSDYVCFIGEEVSNVELLTQICRAPPTNHRYETRSRASQGSS